MPRPTLFDHPKFHRLVHVLGMPEPYVLGHLEFLWRVGYASGNPIVGDEVDVELAAKWQGERGVLADALLQVRFLDRLENGRLEIHDLYDNAPEYVPIRARREQERRQDKVCDRCGSTFRSSDVRAKFCSHACRTGGWRDRRANSDGGVTERDGGLCHGDGGVTERDGTPTPAPAPTPTPRKIKSVSSEPPSGDSQPVPADASPAVLEFPTVGKGGPRWALQRGQLDAWAGLYPTVDVLAAARKALAWIMADPNRRKTAGGMERFLVGWLNRETNQPRTPLRGAAEYRPPPVSAHTQDWADECRELHGGRCGGRYKHGLAMKDKAAAS